MSDRPRARARGQFFSYQLNDRQRGPQGVKQRNDNTQHPQGKDDRENAEDRLHWEEIERGSDVLIDRRSNNTVIVNIDRWNFSKDGRYNAPKKPENRIKNHSITPQFFQRYRWNFVSLLSRRPCEMS